MISQCYAVKFIQNVSVTSWPILHELRFNNIFLIFFFKICCGYLFESQTDDSNEYPQNMDQRQTKITYINYPPSAIFWELVRVDRFERSITRLCIQRFTWCPRLYILENFTHCKFLTPKLPFGNDHKFDSFFVCFFLKKTS